MAKNLIVTGFPRSGTTALADLLNLDSRIMVTYETCSFISRAGNNRRKWRSRNSVIYDSKESPIYMGDKATLPYLRSFSEIKQKTDKIIFCLRDPRDIFRSKYWQIVNTEPVSEYIKLMGQIQKADLSNVQFIHYEWATKSVDSLAFVIAQYLGFSGTLDIKGHNYKPVRRLGWKRKPEVELPKEVKQIMEFFGYE